MHIHWKKLSKILLAVACGAGLFFYTRFSRREMHRLRQNSSIVQTACGPIEVAERGSGDPVLVIQGSTGGYNLGLYLAWPDTGFHYIVPSRPGFLRTPLKGVHLPEQQADLLAALLDTLQIGRAGVIALSGCGPQVFQLALRHPDRITALVLVSVASRPIPLLVLAIRIVRALLRYSPFIPDLIRGQVPDNAFIRPRQTKAVENHPGKIEELRRLVTMVFPATPRLAGMLNDVYWMVRYPQYELEKIDTPTLVVHGERDLVVPLEHARYTTGRIPGATLVTVPDGGHFAFAVFGDEIKDIVLRFLRENL